MEKRRLGCGRTCGYRALRVARSPDRPAPIGREPVIGSFPGATVRPRVKRWPWAVARRTDQWGDAMHGTRARAHRRLGGTWRSLMVIGATGALAASLSFAVSVPPTAAATPAVLRVGTWKGIAGQYRSIAAAVDAAKPGDWVLVAPGDYHEQMDHAAGFHGRATGGVELDKANLHLRGMDRNQVVIDGTKPGAPKCSNKASDQDLGVLDGSAHPAGRNGVEAFEVYGVSIDNLTVCNFLDGADGGGNQIWWNGGDGTGTINMGPYSGSYLSATTTYFADGPTRRLVRHLRQQRAADRPPSPTPTRRTWTTPTTTSVPARTATSRSTTPTPRTRPSATRAPTRAVTSPSRTPSSTTTRPGCPPTARTTTTPLRPRTAPARQA